MILVKDELLLEYTLVYIFSPNQFLKSFFPQIKITIPTVIPKKGLIKQANPPSITAIMKELIVLSFIITSFCPIL